MLEKFERFNERVSGWAEWIGFGAIFLIVVLTGIDVLGSKLFRLPVPGSLDIVMLAQLIAVSFAAAMALIQKRHIAITFLVERFPRRVGSLVEAVAHLLGLILLVIIVWRLFSHGYHYQTGAEVTPTAHIPLAPFAYAAAVATVPVCLVLLQQLLSSIREVLRHEP
jgi:TRAP-type C4-dicarboxylate transport system permease small subunit